MSPMTLAEEARASARWWGAVTSRHLERVHHFDMIGAPDQADRYARDAVRAAVYAGTAARVALDGFTERR